MHLNILIVEDTLKWREILTDFLEFETKGRYIITTAESMEIGLSCFKQQEFDLLITDLRLIANESDNEGGLDLIRDVKAFRPGIPSIIVTLYPSDRVLRKALVMVGVDAFLSKIQLTDKELKEEVERAYKNRLAVRVGQSSKLRNLVEELFDVGDLKGLVFDLGDDFQNVTSSGSRKSEMAIDIVNYYGKRGRKSELAQSMINLRPKIDWNSKIGL